MHSRAQTREQPHIGCCRDLKPLKRRPRPMMILNSMGPFSGHKRHQQYTTAHTDTHTYVYVYVYIYTYMYAAVHARL